MQTIFELWQNRIERNKHIIKNNTTTVLAFDYYNLLSESTSFRNVHETTFRNNNYTDEILYDFRDILEALKTGTLSHHLNPEQFKTETYEQGPFWHGLVGQDITIYHRYKMDQNTYLISFSEEFIVPDMIISIYKSRGRIEAFRNVITGKPVNICNMSDILVALGLENHFKGDYSYFI